MLNCGEWLAIARYPLGTRRCCDVQRRKNVVCPSGLHIQLIIGNFNYVIFNYVMYLESNNLFVFFSAFSGCFKRIYPYRHADDLTANIVNLKNVNLDGCPQEVNSADPCLVSQQNVIYRGNETTIHDHGLNSFTGTCNCTQ